MTKTRLIKHFIKNQFWFWTAIEDYALVAFFMWSNHFFDYPGSPPPPMHWDILDKLDDPISIVIITAIATFSLTYAIWDMGWLGAPMIVYSLNFALWSLFAIAFLQRDSSQDIITLYPLISGALALRILSYSVTGLFRGGGD